VTTVNLELERKYEVPEDFVLPSLAREIPALSRVDDLGEEELVATYFDTADLRLIRQGITLRRRSGGADEGWHLKLPGLAGPAGGRDEIAVPLTEGAEVPETLRRLVTMHVRSASLAPVATLRTRRRTKALVGRDDGRLAEVVDDRVEGETTAAGVSMGNTFRELEVELKGDGTADLLDEVGKVLDAAGAASGRFTPKLARVLGPSAELGPEVPIPAERVDVDAPARDLVQADVRDHVRALMYWEPLVRRDEYDSVHKMRVSVRRLRSSLRTFAPLVDAHAVGALEPELRWLAEVLGKVRDAEVVRERLMAELAREPSQLVVGAVAARLDEHLLGSLLTHRACLLTELDGERYLALLDAVVAFAADPPLTAAAHGPVAEVLPPLVRKAWKKLRKRVGRAEAADPGQARDEALHSARKAAKQARYAGEGAVRSYGSDAGEFAKRCEAVQEALGVHQDSVVVRELLRELALSAFAAGENTLTYGVLIGREECRADRAEEDFGAAWQHASRGRYRRWLKAQ
jgi:CHAD domain-containing protein